MDKYTLQEEAYKRGYEAGKSDAIVHGRWDEIEEEVWHLYKRWSITRFRCSQCKQMENKKSNYCPNCGARMDLEG